MTGGGRMQKGPAIQGGVDLESITMSAVYTAVYTNSIFLYCPSSAKCHLPASKLTSVPTYHLTRALKSLTETGRMQKGPEVPGGVDLEAIATSPYYNRETVHVAIYCLSTGRIHLVGAGRGLGDFTFIQDPPIPSHRAFR